MKYRLRYYQEDCRRCILEKLMQYPSTLVEMATGLGKTVLLVHTAHDWQTGRVLIIVHRQELADQTAEKWRGISGEPAAVEMGAQKIELSLYRETPRVVIASIQTMSRIVATMREGQRPKNRHAYEPNHFGLLIIDEAHHAVARSYRDVIDYFAKAKVLGVSATLKRSDELAMGQVFVSVAYQYSIEPAVDDGWLVPVRQKVVKVEGLDFSRVHKIAGDFNEAELEQILTEEKIIHAMVAPTIELAGDESCLFFCVSVAHARLTAEVLNRYKPHSAKFLSGESSTQERREIVEAYRRGDVQFLCNCALFLEGFDAPNTSIVVMGRPTGSTLLYTQMLGRGTRTLPGIVDGLETREERRSAIATSAKPFMAVLDFVGNSGKHKIIQAADVLGGKYGEPVRSYAKKNLEEEDKNAPVAIEDALDRADAEMALENEERERRRHVIAQADYSTHECSPWGAGRQENPPGVQIESDRITGSQLGYLLHLAYRCNDPYWTRERAARLSKRQATGIIARFAEMLQ